MVEDQHGRLSIVHWPSQREHLLAAHEDAMVAA
jgi:hypothetical protein